MDEMSEHEKINGPFHYTQMPHNLLQKANLAPYLTWVPYGANSQIYVIKAIIVQCAINKFQVETHIDTFRCNVIKT